MTAKAEFKASWKDAGFKCPEEAYESALLRIEQIEKDNQKLARMNASLNKRVAFLSSQAEVCFRMAEANKKH